MHDALVVEQPGFGGDSLTGAVSGDTARGREHAVTADDDRHRVGADGPADGTARSDPSDVASERTVRDNLAETQGRQAGPDAALKLGAAGQMDRKIEGVAAAGEVLTELLGRLPQHRGRIFDVCFKGKVPVGFDRE